MKILFSTLLTATALAIMLAIASVAVLNFHRPGMPAYQQHLLTRAPDNTSRQLSATWLGVSTLLISDGEHAVLTDPFLSRPEGLGTLLTDRPVQPDPAVIAHWLPAASLSGLLAMVVGHSHYDHLLDVGPIGHQTGATLLGSRSTANVGLGAGLPGTRVRVARPNVAMDYGPFRITFIPSVHAGATGGRPRGDIIKPLPTPAPISAFKQGGTWSILIEHELGSILHHGSAGVVPGALAKYQADLVMLGVALMPDLETYIREVVDAVGAKRVIPTHWDDFTRPLSQPLKPLPMPLVNLQRFFDDMAEQRPDISVETLPLGEPRVLFSAE